MLFILLSCSKSSPNEMGTPNNDHLLEDTASGPMDLGVGVEFIPAGSFEMGCTEGDVDCAENEYPSHPVEITSDFYLMQTEVTQELYEIVMGENPSEFVLGLDYPVEEVSWFDAAHFANELSRLEGRDLCYIITEGSDDETYVEWPSMDCTGWRLPTEAEWEYAARGNEDFIYAGSASVEELAWFEDNAEEQSHSVGIKLPNAFGLHDMSGNVEEWCWDGFQENGYQLDLEQGTVQDPMGSNGPVRVLRGGGWGHPSRFVRVSSRIFVSGESVRRIFGFRLGRDVQ